MINGLSHSEATEKLKQEGYNELPAAERKTAWRIIVEVVKEPMFLLLIACAVLYGLMGDYREGLVMMGWVWIIIALTWYQYRKTENALEALRKLSSPRVLVLRDGTEIRIPGREVVTGDVIFLNEGDRVAADADILESLNLKIDESMLTGEAHAVDKEHSDSGKNKVFSGTLVVRGKGLARVTATGLNTEFGKIGSSLRDIEEDQTRLQKEMKILIRNLSITGAILCIGVVAAFYLTRGNFIQSLLNGLAAAMAILPEEFPLVLTIFFALGAWRLSRVKVLTRKSSAIESLGSATVLCSDKTGTITQNIMEIAALYDGKILTEKDHSGQFNESTEALIRAARFASQIRSTDPMEKAIHTVYESQNPEGTGHELVKEYPLSHELLAMTRVSRDLADDSLNISAKGAPEAIFQLCRLDAESIALHTAAVRQMAEKGYRVIGVAVADHAKGPLPDTQSGFEFHFLGLIGLEDPIRPEVPDAIKDCYAAGIRVIMITGDFPATAISIAERAGLKLTGIISGDELVKMDDDELKEKIRHTNIFARVVPEQKLRIVKALKANNEIVAMTGDGINDAPALKAAHIGVAMGNKGTDVAREASSLVLLDDNFASIVGAIRSGRRIYDNLQKAMSYILAIHMPIIGLVFLPAFNSALPLFLMPLHIVFMELIVDPVCSIAFESEIEEKGIMNRPPRNSMEQFFGGKKIISSVLQGLLLLGTVLAVYLMSLNEGHSDDEVRAIAFATLILGNISLVLSDLSGTRYVPGVFTRLKPVVYWILGLPVVLLFLSVSVPFLQELFNFSFPGYRHFTTSIVAVLVMLSILELIKYFRNQRLALQKTGMK